MSDLIPPLESPREASDNQAPLLAGHTYDGIKEYDNPMPRWWVATFWLTIVFSIAYVPAVHFFGWIDNYGDDLRQQTEKVAAVRAAYEQQNPTFEADEASLATFVQNASAVEAGGVIFQGVCAACHGEAGQGLIGPNLTDEYWIHGGSNTDIFRVLKEGVLDKGMPAWESQLSGEERAQLVAYVQSLAGTNPPGAKEPQGEPYTPAE